MAITDNCITETNLNLPHTNNFYRGKVREVYTVAEDWLVAVASDRISAFDHILPRPIPYKGQVLNGVAAHFLNATRDVVPNWLEATPHPNVSIGRRCEPIPIEMVIRGYLTGHAWRTYKSGKRELCGVILPEGMKEHDRFPEPIITPATKAEEGHDEDISKAAILERGIVSADDYAVLETYTRRLFERGTQLAAERSLILVDTKYEFGYHDGQILLIDEVHTPDSSRYFYLDGYEERQQKGEVQQQLSKEFVREWLMENGFQGLAGQQMPEMPDDFVRTVSKRYIDLYEQLTGVNFVPSDDVAGMENAVKLWLNENS
ncbi:MAG: phosphoribosylaminoimidazolesuccinocarboxamide synthase [Bacteroidota bacterium]